MMWSRIRGISEVKNQAEVSNEWTVQYQIRSWIKVKGEAATRNVSTISTERNLKLRQEEAGLITANTWTTQVKKQGKQ